MYEIFPRTILYFQFDSDNGVLFCPVNCKNLEKQNQKKLMTNLENKKKR